MAVMNEELLFQAVLYDGIINKSNYERIQDEKYNGCPSHSQLQILNLLLISRLHKDKVIFKFWAEHGL